MYQPTGFTPVVSSSLSTAWCTARHTVSSRMSNSSEPLVSKGTQDAPRYVSSPPPAAPPVLSCKGPPSPSFPAAPATCPPSKTEMTGIHQPAAGYGSLLDFHPEASPDTTLLMDSSSFDEEKARRAFAKKVFWVLTLQMLFSFAVLCASFSIGKDYVSSLLTVSGFAAGLSICKSFSRRHPWNIAGWVVVTVSLSHMVGTIASFLDLNHVFITVGVLMVIAVAIVAFSAKTHHHDVWDGLLMTLTVDVVAFAFLHLLLPRHL
uniref:Uncharacterized protein n=1 Tax=Gasterosteus aculeatus aculeatus TaxID=481459 RepID=A0AAQ4QAQ5_GASAC